MIRKFIYPLIAIILFSSCANKFSLQKRKYTKGFYFASAKTNPVKESEHNKALSKARAIKTDVINEEVAKSETVAADQKPAANPVVPETNETKQIIIPNSAKQIVASANKTTPQTQKTFKNIESIVFTKSGLSNQNQFARKGESGAKLVVMVILCFFPFINLIPVFIHDNGITLNFWITLLLCFTLLGGIIFSLLVVLDVVDLA